jgi:hypothetical protein
MALNEKDIRRGLNLLANRLKNRPLIRDLPSSPNGGSTVYLEDPRQLFYDGETSRRQRSHLPTRNAINDYEREHVVHVVYNGPYKADNYYRYLNHDRPVPSALQGESLEERSARLDALPTRETAGPGYAGPYRPEDYYKQSFPHQGQGKTLPDNVIFDPRFQK